MKPAPTFESERMPMLMDAFRPLTGIPINRENRRKAREELVKLTELIWPIEKEFIEEGVFGDMDYHVAYRVSLEKFLSAVGYIQVEIKPKYWQVWKDYFMESFKPVK